MSSPISGRPGSGYSFIRPDRPRISTPEAAPAGHVQREATGSLGRYERTLLRDRQGVDRFDPSTNSRLGGTPGAVLGQVGTLAEGRTPRAEGSVAALDRTGHVGTLDRDMRLRALQAGGEASARYSVSGQQGVQAQASAQATAGLADLRIRTPGPNGREVGSVFAGATAGVTGTLSLNPRSGEARVAMGTDNFAGVRATGEVRVGNENLAATARATVQAGIGFNARIEGGLQNNRLTFRTELGASLGIGARFGVNVDVNLQPARDLASRAAGAVADSLRDTRVGRLLGVGDMQRSRGIPLPG